MHSIIYPRVFVYSDPTADDKSVKGPGIIKGNWPNCHMQGETTATAQNTRISVKNLGGNLSVSKGVNYKLKRLFVTNLFLPNWIYYSGFLVFTLLKH